MANAQQEYVITKDDDTIYGKVSRRDDFFNPRAVRFKIKTEAGEKIKLEAKDLKAVKTADGLDGEAYFIPLNDKEYVKQVLEGRINLYLYSEVYVYMVSKAGQPMQSAAFGLIGKRKKAKAQVIDLIRDNKEVLKEFETMKPNINQIIAILKKYNETEVKLTCDDFKNGTFIYDRPGLRGVVTIKTDSTQVDKYPGGLVLDSKINWLSDCSFELEYTAVNRDIKNDPTGTKNTVVISEIDNYSFTCRVISLQDSKELKMIMIDTGSN